MSTYCLATGVAAGAVAFERLCDQGLVPTLSIGYDSSLAARAGYISLEPVSQRYDVPLIETSDINSAAVREAVEVQQPRLLVVAGWSQIVAHDLIEMFPLGAVGLHPTKLPQGRGRAPIPWTLIKGIAVTAVTLFHLEDRPDTGDIVAQEPIAVSMRDDASTLYEKVAEAQAKLLVDAIPLLLVGRAIRRPQPEHGTEWPRRRPKDGIIDWRKPARELYNWVRGLTHPYPGAFCFVNHRRMFLWSADLLQVPTTQEPGTVLGPVWSTAEGGVAVSTGEGILILRRIEFDDDEEAPALELYERGYLIAGARLD